MRLDSVYIKNYRCFEEVELDLDERLTLLVGKNGAGKTALLDAAAVAASTSRKKSIDFEKMQEEME